MSRRQIGYLVAAGLIALFPFISFNDFYLKLAQEIAYLSIAAIGLNILVGLSGQLSLGHAGFFALGAYGSAILATTYRWPLWSTLPVGLVVSGIAGMIVGLVALRARSHYLAMATLAFGFIVEIIAQRWIGLTGGTMGLFGVPQLYFGNPSRGPTYFFWAAGGSLLVMQMVNDYVMQSVWGRNLRAIKENESFAANVGLNVPIWRTGTFLASAVLAGLAGMYFVHQNGYVSSDAFNLQRSINMLIAVVIGGLGHPYGAIAGTLILTLISQLTAGLYQYTFFIFGGILLVVMLVYPGGAAGLIAELWRKLLGAAETAHVPAGEPPDLSRLVGAIPVSPNPGHRRPVLEVQEVSKHYEGVVAVDGLSMTVRQGTVHALIGPNGAGKSSIINVISGLYRANQGTMRFLGEAIGDLPAHARTRLGIARTFQNQLLIANLSVVENVMLGAQKERPGFVSGFVHWLFGRGFEAEIRERAMQLLQFLGAAQYAHHLPGDLSYGHRKLCELARALMQKPTLMLLDEPIAGLTEEEAADVGRAIAKLRDIGITILLVEHNVSFVMGISDVVTVLDYGRKIAEGRPEEIQRDPKVIDAYLGREMAI